MHIQICTTRLLYVTNYYNIRTFCEQKKKKNIDGVHEKQIAHITRYLHIKHHVTNIIIL